MATSSTTESLQVVLIQARNTQAIEQQERTCFLERCRLGASQLHTVNVVRQPLSRDVLDGADALLLGGAGEYSALDDPPWMPNVLALIRVAADRQLPTFGSCWGHQLIARAFGGTLVHDTERAELGSGTVTLTNAGRNDALFGRFSPTITVNMGHHDRVKTLPAEAVELAYNASQRNQAFRLKGRPVYGTQFHSELNARRERERLITYQKYYRDEIPDAARLQRIIATLQDTTEVDGLLHDFLVTFAVPYAASRS